MRSRIAILGISLMFCLSSCSQDFNKISDSEVEKAQAKIAQDFATNYLTQLSEGKYYEFQNEAIDGLKAHLTKEKQKTSYQQIKKQFGDFKSLEYSETWVQGGDDSMLIFRFKGDFEKSHKKLEVRVVLNDSKKIVGFWIKPWSDILM